MDKNKIDFRSLEKALAMLKKSIKYLRSDNSKNDAELREQFRSAVIQSFEYTYELSYKMIKRQLEKILPNPSEVDQMDYKTLIRSAAESGLIDNATNFFNYREKRNITAHTYDENKAELIIAVIDTFVSDISYLIASLKKSNS